MEARPLQIHQRRIRGDGVRTDFQRAVVIQTAFLGDAILTLPLVQKLKDCAPDAEVDIVVTPHASELFTNHRSIKRIIPYDKRGADKGVRGFARVRRLLAARTYDLAVVPHRSIRSALLARLAGIPLTIGFDRSAGRLLFSDVVRYRSDVHEIERNLSLLTPLGVPIPDRILPSLYPGADDKSAIDQLTAQMELGNSGEIIAVAPGTIWNTKRWPAERFAEVCRALSGEGRAVVLIGSESDRPLCEEIRSLAGSGKIFNTAGTLSLLQSAELIKRCRVLLSNDSAPMHMAVAVRTPVVAIFGATVPAFGFSPYGEHDVVVETTGLTCRPCSVHGGPECPIKTFNCMNDIHVDRVLSVLHTVSQTLPPR